jgi:hypothetical protein
MHKSKLHEHKKKPQACAYKPNHKSSLSSKTDTMCSVRGSTSGSTIAS